MSNNIPKLRFPEFTGEWEMLPLSHYLYEHKTKSDGKCVVHSVSVTKGVINQVEYLGRSFAASDTSKYNLVKPYDVIYTKSPTGSYPYGIIKQNKNPYNVIVSPLYAVYTPINKYVGYILDSYFESPVNTNNYLSSLIQKGAKNTIQISNDTFISKSISLPASLSEQEKIAEFLTEMDNLIAAQGEKVEALKEKKKGLMQQLFPQNGETTPRLRFPGFEGEWEEKKFKDFTFAVGKKNRQNLPYDRYSISNEKGFYPQDEQFEGGAGYLKNIDCKMYIIVPPKSFAYNPARINIGSIGYQNLGKDVIVSSLYEVFQVDNTCDDSFLWHWFHSDVFRKMVLDVQEGGVRQYFFYEKLKECSINLPSKKEQQTIASFLSEFDNLISSESNKLENLKNYKKGLMQQLFPQPVK